MKIFLIGMPGSGKTTLGKKLAERLNVDFVDLDSEIEKMEGKSIPEIFSRLGEDHFRLTEARLLREWAASPVAFVMATGGGAPCFHGGMQVINETGLSIFLDCPLPELLARVKNKRERPLLLTSEEDELKRKLETMRESRLSCYRQAKLIIEDPTLQVLLEKIQFKK